MRRPNFFIVGAPKCGTTALYEYLRTHPNVFLPEVKEPHYFVDDFPRYRKMTSEAEYLDLFRDANESHLAVGEASVFYLYSKVAVRNLLEFRPDAQIIVMLRNPVHMVYSLHSQHVFSFRENERDFARAWALQSARAQGKRLPAVCPAPEFLQYGDVGRLGCQVERLLQHAPREQVKIILLDDLAAFPERVYGETLSFLGLPRDDRTTFERINENKVHRLAWFSRLMLQTPFPLSVAKSIMKWGLHVPDGCVRRWILERLSAPAARAPLPTALEQELIAYYRPEVRKLEEILGRDLKRWAA
ncbi:MAG: sulfotransferase [Pirellulales bacterium]|nr:sulfotransferase [Pirellulales bacterium]